MIGLGEIRFAFNSLGNLRMFGKRFAVVEGERMYPIFKATQQGDHAACHRSDGYGSYGEENAPDVAWIDKRPVSPVRLCVPAVMVGVRFPITQTFTLIGTIRTFVNVHPGGDAFDAACVAAVT